MLIHKWHIKDDKIKTSWTVKNMTIFDGIASKLKKNIIIMIFRLNYNYELSSSLIILLSLWIWLLFTGNNDLIPNLTDTLHSNFHFSVKFDKFKYSGNSFHSIFRSHSIPFSINIIGYGPFRHWPLRSPLAYFVETWFSLS